MPGWVRSTGPSIIRSQPAPHPALSLHLENLNPEQLAAVTLPERHALILAGAGSGKTRVITAKIAHLVTRGVAPEKIVAITFTNKAAREMRERARAALTRSDAGNAAAKMAISTFHAYGLAIVRAEARKIMEGLGYNKDNPLKVKISTRNIAIYRDPAVLLIDQLKQIHVAGELEVIDTSIWHAKVTRGEFSVGMNLTGVGVDDPDVNLYENYACSSERNLTKYCNKEVDALIAETRMQQEPAKRAAAYDKIAQQITKDRPIVYLYHRHWLWAHTAKLTGLRAVPDGMVRVHDLRMQK